MTEFKVDAKDHEILEALRKNARLSVLQLAQATKIPPTTIHNRLKKLRKEGIIESYTIRVNKEKLGKKLGAFIFCNDDPNQLDKRLLGGNLQKEFMKDSRVAAAYALTGRYDFVLKVYAGDIKEITDLVENKIRTTRGVIKTETAFFLEELEK